MIFKSFEELYSVLLGLGYPLNKIELMSLKDCSKAIGKEIGTKVELSLSFVDDDGIITEIDMHNNIIHRIPLKGTSK